MRSMTGLLVFQAGFSQQAGLVLDLGPWTLGLEVFTGHYEPTKEQITSFQM